MQSLASFCFVLVLALPHSVVAVKLRAGPDVAAQVAMEGRENIEIHDTFASQEQKDVREVEEVKANTAMSALSTRTVVKKTYVRGLREGCGEVPTYENSKPKEYKDARKTFYNETSKKTEAVTFAVDATIEFKCEPGFTTDGSKDGMNTYEVKCTKNGYFKPAGMCMAASKCGPVPNITNAVPIGGGQLGRARLQCVSGYSLDKEKVVKGGLGKNNIFELECIEFSGEYEKFTGECVAASFTPSTETAYVYNKVTEALFVVSCQGTLKKSFGKGEEPDLGSVCGKFTKNAGACAGLVSTIKSGFTAQLAAKKTHDETAAKDKDWFERNGTDAPKIGDKAKEFCEGMWGILKFEPTPPTL